MANVKPNPKKLRRVSAKVDETGYHDYFFVAHHEDLVDFPVKPALGASTSFKTFATATGGFGEDAVWSKIEVKRNTIKVTSKNLGTLENSSAVETLLSCTIDIDENSLGFVEMHKRCEVQIVVPKINGQLLWIGRKESPAMMQEFTEEESLEKSTLDLVFSTKPFARMYLAPNTVINEAQEPVN